MRRVLFLAKIERKVAVHMGMDGLFGRGGFS